MNDTQWMFEFESYIQSKNEKYEEYKAFMEAWRVMLINVLGLNLMPIEEEEGGRLRMPTYEEIMPFSLIAGREEVVSAISKKLEDFRAQNEADEQLEFSNDSFDSIEDFEDKVPDMVFPDDPEDFRKFMIQNNPSTKRIIEAWTLPLDKKDEDNVKSNTESRKPKKSRLKVE